MSAVTYGILFLTCAAIQVLCLLCSLLTLTGIFTRFAHKEIHPNARQMVGFIAGSQFACLVFCAVIGGLALMESPTNEECNLGYKICAFWYAFGVGLFYGFLFRRSLAVNIEYGIKTHWSESLMKWTLIVGIPLLGTMLAIFAEGVSYAVPPHASDGSVACYCTVRTTVGVYSVLIMGDLAITALFTFLFVRPLRETIQAVKPSVTTTDIVENVLREGIYTGVFSVVVNFISLLILALSDILHGSAFDCILWQSGPGIIAISNSFIMFYDM